MRVWTDGSTHLVLGPKGLTRHSKGKAEVLPLGEAPSSVRGQLAWHARGILAVDPKSQTAWVEWAGKLREVKLAGGVPAKALDWKAKDLVIREDGSAVAVLDAGKGKGKIVAGPVPADGKWKKTLEVPDAAKVKWPAGMVWAKGVTPPWSKAKEPGHDAYLASNPSGLVLAERSSGIVAVMRPGKAEFEFAVRVPTQDEADLTAAATPQGVLITLCIEGRNSALVHVDAKGKILASLATVKTELEEELAWGLGPAVLVGGSKAFVVHEYTIPQVLDLKLPDLGIEATWELPATSEGEKSVAVPGDGKTVLLGFGTEVWMLTRTTSGWQLDELGGSGGGMAPGEMPDDDLGPDIDIAAALKAALGGGKMPAAADAAAKKKPKVKPADEPLPEDEWEAREREEPVAKKKKKKKGGPDIKELDPENLGFGDLADDLTEGEDEDEEEEELEAREPGDDDLDEDEDREEGEEGEEEGPRAAKAAKPAPAAVAAVGGVPVRRPSIDGDPALTLVAQAGGPKVWSGKPGEAIAIDVGFGNVGGPSKGIFLEVEGGPIGAKKLVPKAVRVGTQRVPFAEPKGNKARVEIKDLSLQAGAMNEKAGQPPVPSQVLTVTLELDASQAADDLLLVRMGPLRVPRPGAGAFTHGKRLLIAP